MRNASSLPRLDDAIDSFDDLQSTPSSRRTTYRPAGNRSDTLRSTLQRGEAPLLGGCFPRQLLPSCTISGLHPKNLPGIRDDSNFAIGSDYRRRPITALASKGFWSGVSELKDVLSPPKNPLSVEREETAKFYIKEATLRSQSKTEKLLEKLQDEGFDDNFFEDMTCLVRRQSMLFQRCCEQLKDIYQTESEDMMNGKDEINVSVPFLSPSDRKRSGSHDTLISNSTPEPNLSSVSEIKRIVSNDNDNLLKSNKNKNLSDNPTFNVQNDNFKQSKVKLSLSNKKNINRNDNSPTVTPPSSVKTSPFGEVDMADIEELYTEFLYAILNPVGCDAPNHQEQLGMIEHLRRAFRISPNRHVKLFDIASTTEKPERKLNISVLSAKNLAGKDNLASSLKTDVSKGDPFVTFYLKSRPYEVQNTNTQPPNLNPTWKENFVLRLDDVKKGNLGRINQQDDFLHVDVWNYIIDETPKEKLRKISRVKDQKGLKQFVSDLTDKSGNNHNSDVNSKHKLIGSVDIPLTDIPAAGLDKWWNLEKLESKAMKRSRGQLNIVLQISTTDKDSSIVLEEHRRLLKILLTHELLTNNSEQFQWKDDFSKEALLILSQHAIQGRMNRFQTAMIRWLVYCEIHNILPLDYRVFTPILEKIRSHVLEKSMQEPADTNLDYFKLSVEKFIHQCVTFVRKHRYYLGNNYSKYFVQLESILKCLHILHCFKWRTKDDIILRVEDAIVKSVREWYNYVAQNIICLKSNKRGQLNMTTSSSSCSSGAEDSNDQHRLIASQIRKVTKLAHLMTSDIKASIKQYKELFRETLNINYVELTFKEFENNLCLVSKDLVVEVCNGMTMNPNKNNSGQYPSNVTEHDLKNRQFSENMFDNIVVVPEYEFKVGTRLFELYLALQSFQKLTCDILPQHGVKSHFTMDAMSTSTNSTISDTQTSSQISHCNISNYYIWFLKGVSKWLDIALLKAIKRIFKAVALDNLSSPVDELVQHTSSAVDIKLVFGQIRTFWNQLSWPDAETAYVFVSRILDDLCKATIFYGDRMCQKVQECHNKSIENSLNRNKDDSLHFTIEQCHALNNIVFILQSVQSFPSELGKDDIISKIEETNGGQVADACKKTIDVLVQNAVEDVENQILQVLKRLSEGMCPRIIEILSRTEPSNQNVASNQQVIKDLIDYLDTNLIFLKTSLVNENFERVLSVVWKATTSSLSSVINLGIANRAPIPYFSNLHQTFKILLNFFFGDNLPQNDIALEYILHLLDLYSCGINDLVLSYYNRRYMDQRLLSATSTYPIGSITLRALLDRSHLRIEILNSRHLKPSHIQRKQYGEDFADSSNSAIFSRNSTYRRSYAFGVSASSAKLGLPIAKNVLDASDSKRFRETNNGVIQADAYHPNGKNNLTTNGNLRLLEPEDKITRIRDRLDEMRSTLLEETALMQRNHSSNGNRSQSCNPYVSARLVPDIDGTRFRLNGAPKVKSKIQESTLFPLFDENFEMVLPEDTNLETTYLLLTVKDKCLMGEGIFLGESLLPLKNIQRSNSNINFQEVPQIQLALCRPTKNHEDILFALQTRLSTNTSSSSSSSKEKRGRRSASTPPSNSLQRNENVPMTTTTSHHRRRQHINEIDVNVNRISSNPSLQFSEASNFVINKRKDNSHTSTIGSAREFLRKERRKRLF